MRSSLCIPRIETSTPKDYIYKTICNLQVGYIEKLIEIPLRNDASYKRIIIKINWNNTEKSTRLQEILETKGSIKLVHDMPWYWKIVASLPQK
jgi:hypothetical protein